MWRQQCLDQGFTIFRLLHGTSEGLALVEAWGAELNLQITSAGMTFRFVWALAKLAVSPRLPQCNSRCLPGSLSHSMCLYDWLIDYCCLACIVVVLSTCIVPCPYLFRCVALLLLCLSLRFHYAPTAVRVCVCEGPIKGFPE